VENSKREKLAQREVQLIKSEVNRLKNKENKSEKFKKQIDSIVFPEGVVEPVPDGIGEILGSSDALGGDFMPVLEQIKEINDFFIGDDIGVATCLASNMPRVYKVQEDLFFLAKKLADYTVKRTKNINPVETFISAADFGRGLLNKGLYRTDLITPLFIVPWSNCYEWCCYQNTWADLLPINYDGNKAKAGAGDSLGFYRQVCVDAIGNSNWFEREKTEFLLEKLNSSADKNVQMRGALRDNIAQMASDIMEMRPFICSPNFSATRTVVKIAPDVYASWSWAMHVVGGISIGWSERGVREKMDQPAPALNVNAVGMLSPQSLPWLTLDKFGLAKRW